MNSLVTWDQATETWRQFRDGVPATDAKFRPVSYPNIATARTALGAPTSANYVMWNDAWSDLEEAFVALQPNDILVLPERDEPYWIDSSDGFMARDVVSVDGTGSNGMKDGSRVPIVSNPRLWFAMSRARRGIIGLGPRTVIAPTNSGWTAPRQPILQNEPSGTQLRYMVDGTSAALVGAMNKLIETEHATPFLANFVLQGRDFGGVAYNGIAVGEADHATVKRIYFDGCWRGHAGVPNGETGGLSFLRGTYLVENSDFRSQGGPSPIMWNRTVGGNVRHVRSSKPNYGMWTFWRCGGVNILEDVWMECAQIGFNLEENLDGFEMNYTGGRMSLDYPSTNKFHLNMNPSGGSMKVHLVDVDITPNGYTEGYLSAHVYSTPGVQKRSDVTCNTLPISYLPGSNWIA